MLGQGAIPGKGSTSLLLKSVQAVDFPTHFRHKFWCRVDHGSPTTMPPTTTIARTKVVGKGAESFGNRRRRDPQDHAFLRIFSGLTPRWVLYIIDARPTC